MTSSTMPDEFQFDVFLSHSAKDKVAVRPLAERLRQDGRQSGSQPSTFNPQPTSAPLNQERRFMPELHPLAFILQPFPAAPITIKGSMAQRTRLHTIL